MNACATISVLLLSVLLIPLARAEDPDCACYANGQRFAQKQVLCIRGQQMVCGMSSNVSSWISINQSCQVSFLVEENQLTLLK